MKKQKIFFVIDKLAQYITHLAVYCFVYQKANNLTVVCLNVIWDKVTTSLSNYVQPIIQCPFSPALFKLCFKVLNPIKVGKTGPFYGAFKGSFGQSNQETISRQASPQQLSAYDMAQRSNVCIISPF